MSSWCRKSSSLLFFGLMGMAGTNLYDDFLIWKQCNNKAMEKACHDPQLLRKLGDNIQQGPWWESSLCIDHEGHSAACHIPIIGTRGHARMHLRAVRYEEKISSQFYYVWPGSGTWEMLVLEALIPQANPNCPLHIDLLQKP